MVGVAGKYKGCETCRQRRVKCSMEKPMCQKCVNSGRECLGYERERIFITGTPQTKGRVASHPRKSSSSSKKSTTNLSESSQKPDLTPLQPFTSAWDDQTIVSNRGVEYSLLVLALQTKLSGILRDSTEQDAAEDYHISLPPYAPCELQPVLLVRDFSVAAQCLARLPGIDERDDAAESYCVFFFEFQYDSSSGSRCAGPDEMNRLGPSHFTMFPNHHFFVRVYRPLAVGHALLHRRETFLSDPDWKSIPWSNHPKSLLDQLFDITLFIPPLLTHTDGILSLEPTLNRRFGAQELLHNCLAVERQFETWLHVASQPTTDYPLVYWAEELTSPGGLIPFSNSYTFKDNLTGLAFLYYWTSQLYLHRCIETLHRIIFQPVIDAYPNMWPDLPPALEIDISRYQHGRELAADICRGLDSVLDNTVQPDLLGLPMITAMEFYKEINTTSQDGLMEMMWLENFRSRLVAKGQHVASVLQRQTWAEVAKF